MSLVKLDEQGREYVLVWGDLMAYGSEIRRRIEPGERWCLHPNGNGIIVCHQERAPIWCRFEAGKTVQTPIEFPEHMTATEVLVRNAMGPAS
jgi:hypothetical protein